MKQHKDNKKHFRAWYDRFFLQSPRNAQLEDDVDKMYEAWKGGQQSIQNIKPQPKEPQYLYVYLDDDYEFSPIPLTNEWEYIGKIKLEVENDA